MDKKTWHLLWKAHSLRSSFQKRLKETHDVIERFLSIPKNKKIYVAWSTGKDSTVLLHLVLQYQKNISVMSQNDDIDAPDIAAYRNNIVEKFGVKVDEVSQDCKILQFIQDNNIDITEDITSKESVMSDILFYKPIEKYRRQNKFTGYFMGLRRYESKAREKNFLSRGHVYQKANGAFVCQPLAQWEVRDIFAYFVLNDIPINPIYFKTKFKKSPEHIRSNFLLPGSFSNKGEALWLKYYFPDLFNELAAICPKILAYT